MKHQGPDLQKKAKQAAYLQSKSREYKKHIQHYQVNNAYIKKDYVCMLFDVKCMLCCKTQIVFF